MSNLRRRRGQSDLKRRSGTKPERTRALVVTEGRVTEPRYFSNLARHLRATGTVVRPADFQGAGSDPVNVVEAALAKVERAGNFDEVWCVFDVDEHARLGEAIDLAKSHGFRVAVSNPCFEIWLIWHIKDWTKHCSSQELKRHARSVEATDDDLLRRFPYLCYPDALKRSERSGVPVPDNPGSRVCEVVAMMSGQAKDGCEID